MNDTPKYIQQKQFEIIFSKPLKERLKGLFEMTELSRNILRNRIKTQEPNLSKIDLQVKLFKMFYRFDFDKETLNLIAEDMKRTLIFNVNEKLKKKSKNTKYFNVF
ncbi:MAG: hypothetical protein B6I24_06515 [Bacteroidetes bacterium 4572_128]|nr:MAG: hypothetical protein B6I24_06515 [Bacteroidetes bacterium 4572_128]